MKVVKLEHACEIINGGTPDTKNPNYWGGHNVWITPAEMGNLNSPYLNCSKRMITDEGLKNSSASLLPPYSVIMSSRAPIGHLVINEIPMAFNQGCKGLIPKSNLNYKYLYYFLYANKDYLNSLGSGTTFAEISGSKLKIIEIPLPGMDLQTQIIKKLDKAFAEIDSLEKNLQLKEKKTNQLLQSMLSDTFNNTEDIYMKVTKLGKICEMYQPKTISTKEMVPGGKYTVFGANGAIGKYDKYNHESPQLLVTCRGATCGSVNISEPFSWINGNAMVIKPKENLVTFGYLKYAFLGGINVSGAITGSAQPQITRTTLEQILIPTPSIDYQCLAVEKLDKVFAEIDKVKIQISTEKKQIASLQQSILSNAFNFDEKAA